MCSYLLIAYAVKTILNNNLFVYTNISSIWTQNYTICDVASYDFFLCGVQVHGPHMTHPTLTRFFPLFLGLVFISEFN